VEIVIAIILLRKTASDGKSLSVFGVAVLCCSVDLVGILICFGGLKREKWGFIMKSWRGLFQIVQEN
jgi:hypothetical protein